MSEPSPANNAEKPILVIGGGAWGTALAALAATNGRPVVLFARSAEMVETINATRQNPAYLPDIVLPPTLKATNTLVGLPQCQAILMVTPAQTFCDVAPQIATIPEHKGAPVVLCSKGIDRRSGRNLFDLADEFFPGSPVAVLSGPSFAVDVARGLPTAVTLACRHIDDALRLATLLATPTFRIYASDDPVGTELGGALKNVLAIAVGTARGLALGASAEAALIARGFSEMSRLAQGLGARPETLTGLSGLGDLVLSCTSPQSRNFSYGMAVATNRDRSNLPLAEGVFTASVARKMAENAAVETPIINMVAELLENRVTPQNAVASLLSRPLKSEMA